MRVFFGSIALAATCLSAMPSSPRAEDTFSPSLTSYNSSRLAAGNLALPEEESPRFAGSFELEDAPATTQQQSWWPMAYSALIPGLGELTMGYEKRGIALMALDVAAWAGYYVNHNDGLD